MKKENKKPNTALITKVDEIDNLSKACQRESGGGLGAFIKFKKGVYFIGENEVAIGTELIAYPGSWVKCWIKFDNGKVAERRTYRVSAGEEPVDRNELPDLDEALWPRGYNGQPADPWTLQYLMPLERPDGGELLIFVTSSWGGKDSIRELVDTYTKCSKRGQTGQPIVALAVGHMPTKTFGNVKRPLFRIVGWCGEFPLADISSAIPVGSEKPAEKPAEKQTDDMDDEIPF